MHISLFAARLLAFAGLLALIIAGAWGQQVGIDKYPDKPVRLVVPGTAGASPDIIARLLTQKFTEAWGQQFVVDLRAGAGGAVGAEIVAKAIPDGYTLMLTSPGPGVQNVVLRKKPLYTLTDFSAIAFVGYTPLIIAGNPKFPPNNIAELIAYAKAHPGKMNWGSSGTGGTSHTALEILKDITGANIVHVPYKGAAPAMIDLIGGQIDVLYTSTIAAGAHIKAGRLKILGVEGRKRQATLPDVPTLEEQGLKNTGAYLWLGLVTVTGTPRPIIDKINRELNKVLQMPDVRQRFNQLGLEIEGGTPEDFGAFIKAEADNLVRLVKAGVLQTVD